MFMQMQRYSIILIRGSCWCGQDMAKRLFQMNRFELATSTDLNWCEFWISFKLIFLSNWGQSFCINSNEFPWENPEIHSYSWERAFFQTAKVFFNAVVIDHIIKPPSKIPLTAEWWFEKRKDFHKCFYVPIV